MIFKMFNMSLKMDTLIHNVFIKLDMTVKLCSGLGEDDIWLITVHLRSVTGE